MEHIVSLSFEFDDAKCREIAENTVNQEMQTIIKNIVLDQIAPEGYTYYSQKLERNWKRFYNMINEHMENFIKEHGEEIIERAATKVADSVKRTKVWKEKYSEILE